MLSSLLCYISLKMAVQEDLEEERKEEEELKRQNAKRKRKNWNTWTAEMNCVAWKMGQWVCHLNCDCVHLWPMLLSFRFFPFVRTKIKWIDTWHRRRRILVKVNQRKLKDKICTNHSGIRLLEYNEMLSHSPCYFIYFPHWVQGLHCQQSQFLWGTELSSNALT